MRVKLDKNHNYYLLTDGTSGTIINEINDKYEVLFDNDFVCDFNKDELIFEEEISSLLHPPLPGTFVLHKPTNKKVCIIDIWAKYNDFVTQRWTEESLFYWYVTFINEKEETYDEICGKLDILNEKPCTVAHIFFADGYGIRGIMGDKNFAHLIDKTIINKRTKIEKTLIWDDALRAKTLSLLKQNQ